MSDNNIIKRFETWNIADIKAYEKNPRKNDEAVRDVIESIRQTGNLDPIEVDENGVVLSGHTRLKALKKLGYKQTDVVVYEGLTERQKKKYRVLANKTGEKAQWDFKLLSEELADEDFDGYDFGFNLDEKTEADEIVDREEAGEEDFAEFIDETSQYIVLKFTNETDWQNAMSMFGLKQVKMYSTRKDGKTNGVVTTGLGRVIDGTKAIKMIEDNYKGLMS